MTDRFKGLKKLPDRPVAEILAQNRARLRLPAGIDGAAPPPQVLAALEAGGHGVELVRLLAHVLPRREAVWWGCLAARDIQPEGVAWPTLAAAEAWVFKPGDPAREAVLKALSAPDPDDDATCVATAALHALPDIHGEETGPPGITAAMVEMQVLKSFLAVGEPEPQAARLALLADRGLDIARGGSGRIGGAAAGGGHAP